MFAEETPDNGPGMGPGLGVEGGAIVREREGRATQWSVDFPPTSCAPVGQDCGAVDRNKGRIEEVVGMDALGWNAQRELASIHVLKGFPR